MDADTKGHLQDLSANSRYIAALEQDRFAVEIDDGLRAAGRPDMVGLFDHLPDDIQKEAVERDESIALALLRSRNPDAAKIFFHMDKGECEITVSVGREYDLTTPTLPAQKTISGLYRHLRQLVLAQPNTSMARLLLAAETQPDTLFIYVGKRYKTYSAARAKKWFANPE